MVNCAIAFLLVGLAHGLKISSHTSSRASDPEKKPVFYAIVMGNLAYRHQVSLWLSSLRKLGGFKDEVVLVTDKPVCLAATLTEARLLGPQISSDDNVDIYGPGEGYMGNVHLMKRPKTGSIYKMKMEKTRAWQNVQLAAIPHPVSSIIYTDEDVTIGKDLTDFVSLVRSLEDQKHTLALFKDTGDSAGQLHTGVVVVFPGEATDQCLQMWGKNLKRITMEKIMQKREKAFKKEKALKENAKELEVEAMDELVEEDEVEEEPEAPIAFGRVDQRASAEASVDLLGPDQKALEASGNCKAKKGHNGIGIFPEKYFWFPTEAGLKSGQRAEFVHFTNTNRWKTISHTVIQQYLVNIGIPEHIDPMGNVKDKSCKTGAK